MLTTLPLLLLLHSIFFVCSFAAVAASFPNRGYSIVVYIAIATSLFVGFVFAATTTIFGILVCAIEVGLSVLRIYGACRANKIRHMIAAQQAQPAPVGSIFAASRGATRRPARTRRVSPSNRVRQQQQRQQQHGGVMASAQPVITTTTGTPVELHDDKPVPVAVAVGGAAPVVVGVGDARECRQCGTGTVGPSCHACGAPLVLTTTAPTTVHEDGKPQLPQQGAEAML